MSAELAQHIRSAAEHGDGVRIHVWACAAGYQANIAEPGTNSWTCHTMGDPIEALLGALRQFLTRTPDRLIVPDGVQLDIEDAIAEAPAPPVADAFDDLF